MMRGETVIADGVTVENVLVSPTGYDAGPRSFDAISRPVGPVADYTLFFPFEFTNDITGKKVIVRGEECDVLGHPGHYKQRDVFGSWLGAWDMVVYANRTVAANAEHITVVYTHFVRDSLGDRTMDAQVVLYSGMAQARFSGATEGDAEFATVAKDTYYFVLPYSAEIHDAPTQCLTVTYRDETYDVQSIEDIEEKHEKLSLRAVRRDGEPIYDTDTDTDTDSDADTEEP